MSSGKRDYGDRLEPELGGEVQAFQICHRHQHCHGLHAQLQKGIGEKLEQGVSIRPPAAGKRGDGGLDVMAVASLIDDSRDDSIPLDDSQRPRA